MTAAPIPFRKMNGLGNAFAVIDAREAPVDLSEDAIRALGQADRIGFDQLITLEPDASGADAFMRIHNRDGGEVEACGNATRCVGWLLMRESGRAEVAVQTSAGLLLASSNGAADIVSVDMGVPRFGWQEIPTAEVISDTRAVPVPLNAPGADVLGPASLANMGNPHAIFWVEDIEAHDLERLGPLLEHHPLFPERANISLAPDRRAGRHHRQDLGTRRRPHPRLRNGRLCDGGLCPSPGPDWPDGDGHLARRPPHH